MSGMYVAPPPRFSPRARVLVGVLVTLLVALVGFTAVDRVRNRPPPNLAERFADVAPFTSFIDAGESGWVGQVGASWAGEADPAVATEACEQLLLRLAPTGRQTITIVDVEGLPVRECIPAQ
jgi:hypothetical protein